MGTRGDQRRATAERTGSRRRPNVIDRDKVFALDEPM
jgi:hypothetical protein